MPAHVFCKRVVLQDPGVHAIREVVVERVVLVQHHDIPVGLDKVHEFAVFVVGVPCYHEEDDEEDEPWLAVKGARRVGTGQGARAGAAAVAVSHASCAVSAQLEGTSDEPDAWMKERTVSSKALARCTTVAFTQTSSSCEQACMNGQEEPSKEMRLDKNNLSGSKRLPVPGGTV